MPHLDEGKCRCGHTAHWHGNGGREQCEHDGACGCQTFRPDGHRVVLTFDDGVSAKLICPEGGCTSAGQCAFCARDLHDDETEPCYDCKDAEKWKDECWIKTWFDNLSADELLHGTIEVNISPEWDGDHAIARIEGAAHAAT